MGTRIGTSQRLLLSMLAVGLVGVLAGSATYSAFSVTTTNPGNEFATGTVVIGADASGQALYTLTNQAPGSPVERCVRVVYSGSLPAAVRLYGTPAAPALAEHIDLVVTRGTGAATNLTCTDFTPAPGGAIYSGTLGGFAPPRLDWASGLATSPPGQTQWHADDAVTYRFSLTLRDTAPQGQSTGSHGFTWEARSL